VLTPLNARDRSVVYFTTFRISIGRNYDKTLGLSTGCHTKITVVIVVPPKLQLTQSRGDAENHDAYRPFHALDTRRINLDARASNTIDRQDVSRSRTLFRLSSC